MNDDSTEPVSSDPTAPESSESTAPVSPEFSVPAESYVIDGDAACEGNEGGE